MLRQFETYQIVMTIKFHLHTMVFSNEPFKIILMVCRLMKWNKKFLNKASSNYWASNHFILIFDIFFIDPLKSKKKIIVREEKQMNMAKPLENSVWTEISWDVREITSTNMWLFGDLADERLWCRMSCMIVKTYILYIL